MRNGTTLSAILFEDLIYKTGSGFESKDTALLTYFNTINFTNIFRNTNDHYNKLGNVFVEITTDENFNLLNISLIQPQKCRLTRKNTVIIYPDWTKFDEKKAVTIPLYPKFKSFQKDGIKYQKSIYHIKNETIGFDHYGVNESLFEGLLLNEKEHRRNNWQLNQLKNGFKRDFFLLTEFALNEETKETADNAFKNKGGDNKAGGVETLSAESGQLVPATADYDFDFTKDDTTEQLFLKMGFPRSLVGIKSGAAFSVEQVESDYEQYYPKIDYQQIFLTKHFSEIFKNHTNFKSEFWVKNQPPAIILQNYMQYMNDNQRQSVITNLLDKYGL